MVNLILDNSFSKIEGLSPEAFNRLRKALSYTPDKQSAYFAGGHHPQLKYMIDNKGNFPTGLYHRVLKFVMKEVGDWKEIDKRNTVHEIMKSGWVNKQTIVPYPAQRAAVAAAFKYKRGIISMPTGTGKSLVIMLLQQAFSVKTLIVVPSLEIKKQLTDSIVAIMGSTRNITVENIDSKALKTATDFDMLIVDEAHHVAARTYQQLNKTAWKGIRYRFFTTATPFRNDTEETLLFEGIAGQVIYQLTYKDAIAQKLIVPVEAYYIEMPKQETDAYTWAQVYSTLVVNNTLRNEYIAIIAMRLAKCGISTLVLVKEVAHCNTIVAMSGLNGVHGQDEASREYIGQFSRGEIKGLVGTEGLISEGVDTKACQYVVIAGLGKAKSAFMQKIGRGIRNYPGKESCKVILIKDKSHKFLSRHFNQQCAILKEEYGITPTKIEL